MTVLVVAEKPSVARDIAAVLGARTRGDGFFSGGVACSLLRVELLQGGARLGLASVAASAAGASTAAAFTAGALTAGALAGAALTGVALTGVALATASLTTGALTTASLTTAVFAAGAAGLQIHLRPGLRRILGCVPV